MNEALQPQNGGWSDIASAPPEENEMIGIQVAGRQIAVYRSGGCLYATDNFCTHGHALLTDGWLEDGVIECPLHGGRFDLATGKGLGPPIETDLACHAVREKEGVLQVALGGEE